MTVFDPARYTLLVVDDEPDTRTLAKKILEHEGFTVLQAGDGDSALQVASTNHVDLMLLDVRLPRLNGFEVCARVKAMRPRNGWKKPMVIFFTVLTLDADKERAMAAGGDGFLSKPFSADDLVTYIKTRLAEARS